MGENTFRFSAAILLLALLAGFTVTGPKRYKSVDKIKPARSLNDFTYVLPPEIVEREGQLLSSLPGYAEGFRNDPFTGSI
jgi:hypothetical protein